MPSDSGLCSSGMDSSGGDRPPPAAVPDGVELRHLRALVAVAEAGSLTGAARRLGTGQPAVTRTLAQLEARLDVRLVDRTTRRLHLTAAGRRVLPGVRDGLAALAEALDPGLSAARALRLGHAWGGGGRHTPAVLRGWARRHPDVPLELVRLDDRMAGLTRGLSDVALLRGDVEDATVEAELLDEEPRVAALPVGHPLLADDRPLTMAELAVHPLVVNTVSGVSTPSLWPPRQRPRVGARVTNTDDWLFAVAADRGIGLTPTSTAAMHSHPEIVYRSVVDAPLVPLWVAWPAASRHPWRAELVDLCHEVVAGSATGPATEPATRHATGPAAEPAAESATEPATGVGGATGRRRGAG